EVSASVTGNFTKESDGNGIAQTPSQSAGFLANYRFALSPRSAVELNYGYTRNDQNYNFGIPFFGSSSIQANVHEATAAYVLAPQAIGRLKPFLLAGGGALILIQPTLLATLLSVPKHRLREHSYTVQAWTTNWSAELRCA